MPGGWVDSDRRSELPTEWPQLREDVIERAGGRCEAKMRSGKRCRDKGTDVDHINPGVDHGIDNLQLLCAWHHARKTAAEGNAARKRLTAKRPPERNPGLR